jgi:hypothetical protein
VAWHRGLGAVHGHVQYGAGAGLGVRERGTRAARAGRLGGVGQAQSGRRAWWGLVESGPRNRPVGSRRCWRRGDGSGGGRCGAAQVGVPTVAMATVAGVGEVRLVSLCGVGSS